MNGGVSPAQLAGCDLFSTMGAALLDDIAGRAQLIDFPRGSLMVHQGDAADGFYLITRGNAEVVVETADGGELPVDILSPGDCVGDLAILLDQPRTATVRAIRDCQAAKLSNADFAWLLGISPEFTLRLVRTMGDRLQRTTRGRSRIRSIADVTAVVLAPGVASDRFLGDVAQALPASIGFRAIPLAAPELSRDSFADADAILLVADAAARADTAAIRRLLDLVHDIRPRPQVSLVLLHETGPPWRGALPWLRDRRLASWHHARIGDAGDAGRVARRITGRATGLVLSGGGARGFAHIGVLRACAEAGIPVDFIAGTSMGAIVAGQYAAGASIDGMIDLMRRAYVDPGGLPDFALSSVAIYSGRATERRLKTMFGDVRIEDLPIPYFAVSADLRSAETVIHETGRLWRATRASCSIPGMLPPVAWRGRLLVDGGLLDNLPADALRQRCGGRILASDVSVAVEFGPAAARPKRRWSFARHTELPGIAQILMRTVQLSSVRDSRKAGIPADLYLNPGVGDVGMSDFDRIDEIVERGAAYARRQLEGWAI